MISKIPYCARLHLSGVDNVSDANNLSWFSECATSYSSCARFAPNAAIRIRVFAYGVAEFCYNGKNRATLVSCSTVDRGGCRAAGDNSATRNPQRGRLLYAPPCAYLFPAAIISPAETSFGEPFYVRPSVIHSLIRENGRCRGAFPRRTPLRGRRNWRNRLEGVRILTPPTGRRLFAESDRLGFPGPPRPPNHHPRPK